MRGKQRGGSCLRQSSHFRGYQKVAAGGICTRLLAAIDSQDDPFVSRYKSIYPQIAPVARFPIVTDIIDLFSVEREISINIHFREKNKKREIL